MSIPQFFSQLSCGAGTSLKTGERLTVQVCAEVIDHMRVSRLSAGERFILINEPGHGWELELLAQPEKKSGALDVVVIKELSKTRQHEINLFLAVSCAERMDLSIRQATELGVTKIVPVVSERCNIRLNDTLRHNKHSRWQRIARAAAEQSCQLFEPIVLSPLSLEDALSSVNDKIFFAWEEERDYLLLQAILDNFQSSDGYPKCTLVIGPEGGFSATEAKMAMACGAIKVSLGDTILRCETASTVAIALVTQTLKMLYGTNF
ncbi:MAG: 16S rRNA (uracil(1498)-N(3))-methyltransferase [Coriobacteriales bacterium]|jgi:16S rRNA (uracil1498-N3)-methyltransferase|nr:16S rRNA (uracil(1498)-N(3))-methyltransferase [Coriobacteriales bacterium]